MCFGLAQDKYVAVMTLEPMGLTVLEANVLSERLTNKLVSLKKYIVIERSNVDKIMKEQKFQYSGCTKNQCAVKIGELLNSNYIVIGSVSKFGSTYNIDARIIDVETSEVLTSASYSHKGDIDNLLNEGINEISNQLYEVSEFSNSIPNEVNLKSIDESRLICSGLDIVCIGIDSYGSIHYSSSEDIFGVKFSHTDCMSGAEDATGISDWKIYTSRNSFMAFSLSSVYIPAGKGILVKGTSCKEGDISDLAIAGENGEKLASEVGKYYQK